MAWKEGGVEGLDFAVGRAKALLLDFHLFAREHVLCLDEDWAEELIRLVADHVVRARLAVFDAGECVMTVCVESRAASALRVGGELGYRDEELAEEGQTEEIVPQAIGNDVSRHGDERVG